MSEFIKGIKIPSIRSDDLLLDIAKTFGLIVNSSNVLLLDTSGNTTHGNTYHDTYMNSSNMHIVTKKINATINGYNALYADETQTTVGHTNQNTYLNSSNMYISGNTINATVNGSNVLYANATGTTLGNTDQTTRVNASSMYITSNHLNVTVNGSNALYVNATRTTLGNSDGTTVIDGSEINIGSDTSTTRVKGVLEVGVDNYTNQNGQKGGEIRLAGVEGDDGTSLCRIYTQIYDSSNECSELVLFKGNDKGNVDGPDRIRFCASAFVFDVADYNRNPDTLSDNDVKMMMDNNGNIGIGTTIPSYLLDVSGNIRSTGFLYGGGLLDPNENSSMLATTTWIRQKTDGMTQMFNGQLDNLSTEQNRRLDNASSYHNGRINSANTIIDQHDTRLDQHDTRLDQHDTRLVGHDTRHDQHDTRLVGHDTRLDGHTTAISALSGRVFAIEGNYAKRQDSADIIFGTNATHKVTCTGTLEAQSFNALSDERLKTNIVDLDRKDSLHTLRQLKPKKYDFKESVADQLGFIAQEIKEIDVLSPAVNNHSKGMIPIRHTVHCHEGMFSLDLFLIDLSLNVMDRIQYRQEEQLNTATIVYLEEGHIQLSHLLNGDVYLVGIEIQNLHSIQKDMIYTLAVSALQRLDEIVTSQQQTIDRQQQTIDRQQKQLELQEKSVEYLLRLARTNPYN